MTIAFQYLAGPFGLWMGGLLVAAVVFALAFFALFHLEETYYLDLDFHEPLH